MTVLKSLVVYWLKDGGEDKFLVPPLEDILKPVELKPPLQPRYPAYVNLMAARLGRSPGGGDGSAVIHVPSEISHPLFAKVGKDLQAKGIKVVLSILSHKQLDEKQQEDKKYSVGWSTLTKLDTKNIIHMIHDIKNYYNIDGIDIDDEFGPAFPPKGVGEKNFYETVRAIRDDPLLKNIVISNPIYDTIDELKYRYKPPDEKRHLRDLMTYCATMNYGNDYDGELGIITRAQSFINIGIPKEKLYAGVQPGPFDVNGDSCHGQQFTSIEVSKRVAKWAKTNCAGVMIFSYSTDTVEFARCPRPPKKSGWPDKDDHAWQKAITEELLTG
jgi:Glycosyl hydrolases family 18